MDTKNYLRISRRYLGESGDSIEDILGTLKEPRFKLHRALAASARSKVNEALQLLAELEEYMELKK